MSERKPPGLSVLEEYVSPEDAVILGQRIYAEARRALPPREHSVEYEDLSAEEQGIITGWNSATDVTEFGLMQLFLRDEQINRIQDRRQNGGDQTEQAQDYPSSSYTPTEIQG